MQPITATKPPCFGNQPFLGWSTPRHQVEVVYRTVQAPQPKKVAAAPSGDPMQVLNLMCANRMLTLRCN